MLRKQHDLQINILEQEIDNKLYEGDANASDKNEFEKQRREIDIQVTKYQGDLERDQTELRALMNKLDEQHDQQVGIPQAGAN